jgi:rhodanese-related sulfurtransferase
MRSFLAALLILGACGTPTGTSDAGAPDATTPDACAALFDAGPFDAGADAGADAGGVDAGADAGGSDAGVAALGTIGVEELHTALAAKDFLMIDVHLPYAGEIPGTDAHIAYTEIDALAACIGADLERKVVLTCLGGPMSVESGDALVARGYRQIRWLVGGMNAWVNAGYTLTHELP